MFGWDNVGGLLLQQRSINWELPFLSFIGLSLANGIVDFASKALCTFSQRGVLPILSRRRYFGHLLIRYVRYSLGLCEWSDHDNFVVSDLLSMI